MTISIHALVKRATLYLKYFMLYNIISIHALVKRATTQLWIAVITQAVFQSTPS